MSSVGRASTMACSLQKLFSVEAEFEDEDFLLAVKDVEKQDMGPTPTNLRCLRPLSSGATASSNPSIHTQDLGALGPSMSPVLQVQNYSRLRLGEGNCPSNIGSNETSTPSLAASFKVQQDLATLSGECKSNCTSGTRFKFVNRRPATLPTGGAPHGEDLDNELFLAACMDLDRPDALSHQEPSRSDFKSWEQMEDKRAAAAKRLRTTSSVMPKNPVGSDALHLDRTRKEPPVGVGGQAVEAPPKLALRPTTVGPCLSQSSLGRNTSLAASPNLSCQTPKQPLQAPLVRSFSPSCSVNTSLRPATPQTYNQTSFMPRVANSGAQLLTAYGPVTTPPTTPKAPPSTGSAGNLQTPVVTNHLVRLVTAVNKTPQLTGHLSLRSKTRRFPGPAGILPQHPDGKNLEEILISTPQTPTHGAVAKLQTEEMPASQQQIEEEFGRGPWVAMKTELGLDERDPSCFLRSYSVVMVLRKAALKQLPKNKVPSMAIIIKSLMRTNVDAGAVFKDPTGEMQGTIHRLLLEEKENELKAGAVLLLKQVGIFSPSHRNHYLNVTPNNLVKIYPPGLSCGKPPQLCLELREKMTMVPPLVVSECQPDSPANFPKIIATTWCGGRRGSEMDEDGFHDAFTSTTGVSLASRPGTSGVGKSTLSVPSPKTQKDDFDDLDQLLGELPDDFFCRMDTQSSL